MPKLQRTLFQISFCFFISINLLLTAYAVPSSERPEPTPTPSKGLTTYRALLELDSDCLSPCWWGFELGETKVEEIITFLEDKFERDIHFSEDEDGLQFWSLSLEDDEILPFASGAYITVLSQNDLFTGIAIGYARYDDEHPFFDEYALEKVISNYGAPDKIWFYKSRNSPLMLFYEDLSMLVDYTYRLSYPPSQFNEDSTRVCPRNDDVFTFYVFAREGLHPSDFLYDELFNLEELIGLSPEEFTENLQHQTNWCFDVPHEFE
jgi:hypothetical protein